MENAEMAPKVSIIIPIYNSEKYLERLFGSIQQQTLEDFEVICVNDGSTDNSKIIIENIAKSDQRFRIINQRNAGEGAARNTGLASALGEYIVFFDSDDFVERNMLAEMVEAAEADNAEIVICSIDAYYEIEDRFEPNEWAVSKEVVPTRRVFAPEDIENIFSNIVGYAANKLYKKDFIESHRIFFQEIRTHGDLAFSYAALAASKRIIYLDEPFYHHRIREGSLTSTTQDDYWSCLFEALLFLKTELDRLGAWSRFEKDFVNYALKMAHWKLGRVKGKTKIIIDDALRNVWFEKLGLLKYSKNYFYKPYLYDFMHETMAAPYIERKEKIFEQMNEEMFDQEKTIALTEKAIADIVSSPEYKLGHKILRPFWMLKNFIVRN